MFIFCLSLPDFPQLSEEFAQIRKIAFAAWGWTESSSGRQHTGEQGYLELGCEPSMSKIPIKFTKSRSITNELPVKYPG